MAKTTEMKTEEVIPEVDNNAVLDEIKAREKHMEEMFAQMLALKNEATAQTVQNVQNAKNTVSLPEEIQKREDELHEMVKIKLRKDRNSKLSDLFVSVNGKAYLIKRGVEVEVPRYVAKVIEDAEEQEERAIDYCEELANKFVKETEELGG